MLERLGCTSEELEDGEYLVRALVEGPRRFDAVLLDIVMAHSNGLALVRDLREHHVRSLPVIAATAYHHPGDDAVYARAGFDEVLDKPFTQRQLAQTLSRVISSRLREDSQAAPSTAPVPAPALESAPEPEPEPEPAPAHVPAPAPPAKPAAATATSPASPPASSPRHL